MRKRILDHFPGFYVEAPDFVHVVRIVPEITFRIETQCVRTRVRTGQWKFLEGLRLGVELQHFAAEIFASIDHAVGPYFHAPSVSVRSRRRPFRYFHRYPADFPDLVSPRG